MENEQTIEVEEVHDDDTTTTSEPANDKPAKKCEHCGNDHTRGKKSRFCGDRCKNAWHRSNPRARMNDRNDSEEENYNLPVLQSEKVVLTGIDPKAQYIIQDQARQIRELKQQYLIEKQKRSKAKDKNHQLEKELMQLRNDHALEAVENKKPSTLEGLAASPLMAELMPFLGPALGQLASGMVARVTGGGPQPGGMQGVEGQLDAEAQSQLIEINNWYSKIAPEEQTSVYEVMNTFTKLPADKLKDVLTRMKRLLNHGTTATNHSNGTNRATGTY